MSQPLDCAFAPARRSADPDLDREVGLLWLGEEYAQHPWRLERAVAAGAKVVLPVKDQFWGDRTGRIMDPSGHVWTIATRVEETSSAEREQRWSRIAKG